MALYIDPPRWPAHGTVFSHLVSDSSYDELHGCAGEIGLSRRAFDADHYDVPAELYDAALRAGAREVSGAELIGLLRRSGLRVPARERLGTVMPGLRRRWRDTGVEETGAGDAGLGEELLIRWSESHRHYHTPVHLLECLTALDRLAPHVGDAPPGRALLLAAWFHDAVYEGRAGEDEQRSAELAHASLGGALGAEAARLVLLTREHRVAPGDIPGALLVDADLAILAAPRPRYRRYTAQVRREYAHATDEQWRAGRREVLQGFASRERIFATPWAHDQWTSRAHSNLEWEIQAVESGGPAT